MTDVMRVSVLTPSPPSCWMNTREMSMFADAVAVVVSMWMPCPLPVLGPSSIRSWMVT
jgi:hypothetical protein